MIDNTQSFLIKKNVMWNATHSDNNTNASTIRFSKTDQYGASVTLTLSKSCHQEICPYRLLRRYISLRPSKGGPLFCHLDGELMTKYQFHASKMFKFPQY